MVSNLPVETLQLIFTQIIPIRKEYAKDDPANPSHYGTLAKLCITSKLFRSIAEPILYTSFSPRYGHSLVVWAHTVLQNPRLMNYVREIEFSPHNDFYEPHSPGNTALFPEFTELARKLKIMDQYHSTPLSDIDDRCAKFRVSMWLLLQVICVMLPNIERLVLHTSNPPWFALFWTQTHLPPPNLRELRIEFSDGLHEEAWGYLDDEAGADIVNLGGLLAMPKLQKLHLFNVIGNGDRDTFDDEETVPANIPMNENLMWLRCTSSLFDGQIMGKLVTSFPNLEIFEYHASRLRLQDGAPNAVSGSECVQALMPLVTKLKALSLDLSYQYPNDNDRQVNQKNYVADFTAFERLEDLSVDSMLVLKHRATPSSDGTPDASKMSAPEPESENALHNYFPTNLKSLRITHSHDNLIKPLTKLSENVRKWLPLLEVFQLDFCSGESSADYYLVYFKTLIRMELIEQLNEEYQEDGEEMISCDGYSVPARFVPNEPWKTPEEEYLERCVRAAHLPTVWRNIVDNFNKEGVRVKIGHSGGQPFYEALSVDGFYDSTPPFERWIDIEKPHPVVEFDNDKQMAKWCWQPTLNGFCGKPEQLPYYESVTDCFLSDEEVPLMFSDFD